MDVFNKTIFPLALVGYGMIIANSARTISSHVYKPLQAALCPYMRHQLKESIYINWEKSDLNQQVKHINLTLSVINRCVHAHILILLTSNLCSVFSLFQPNVTYTAHCNRHFLSAVIFHNHHTDDVGCTIETCLLK